jgi:hypothetical protein
MMKNNRIPVIIAICVFAVYSSACSNRQSNQTENIDYSEEISPADSNRITFLVPLPGEILDRLQNHKFTYTPSHLNSPENKTKYLSTRAKALNLGIYISDLAYASLFERTNEAIDYLEAVRFLSQELNISSGIFESLIERSKNAVGKKDSLLTISNEVFQEMIDFLEDGGKMNTIALISSGAFLESIYLAMESVKTYEDDMDLIKQIEELQFPLENILAQSRYSEDDPNVQSIINMLHEINGVFISADSESSQTQLIKNADGILTLSGGESRKLSKEEFYELREKVRGKRQELISY